MLDKTTSTPKRRGGDQRTADIIDAALQLFSEQGYARTRLEDIAEKAGISTATIYLYFENKDDLFYALIREKVVPHVDRTEQIIAQHRGTSSDLLRNIIVSLGSMMATPPLGPAIKLLVAESSSFPHVAAFYREQVIERGLNNLMQAIQAGIETGEFRACDPKVTATLVIFPLLMHGIWRQSPMPHDWMTPPDFLGAHAEMILRGLANPDSERKN